MINLDHIFRLSIWAMAFAFAIPTYAESKQDSLRQEFMDSTLSITQIDVVERKNRTIIPAQTLSGAVLDKLNSQSVADALRYFSGIQLKDYGGIGGIKTVNIRSMGTNHVGVFYNGVQLGNAQNGQVDLGRYSLDNVEAIALYNGQKSDIFQSAKDFGSSGAIYIITRRPRFSDNGRNCYLTGQFRTGSFGLANPSFLWKQKIKKNIHLSVNAEYTYATGHYKYTIRKTRQIENATGNYSKETAYDTTAVRTNGDVHALRAEFGLYGYMPDGKWNVNGYYYDSERGIPGAVVNNVFHRGERQWDKSAFGQASFNYRVNPFYSLKFNAKFAWDYTHFKRPFEDKEIPIDNRYYQEEAYASIANLFTLTDWWSIDASFDVQWNKLNADLYEFPYPYRWTELAVIATNFSFSHFDVQASLLGNFVQDRLRSKTYPGSVPAKKELSPAIFFSYQPFLQRDFRLDGFFKRAFRMPTFNDLYYTEVGYAYLNPEYTTQYNIGSSFSKQKINDWIDAFSVRGDAYYNRISNKIVAYPAGGSFRWTMRNLGKVEVLGAEISANAAFHIQNVGLKALLQYTYQRARDITNTNDSEYGDQIPYTPKHSGSCSVNAGYSGWDLNYSFIYTGERYNESENIAENYEPAWYTNDISLSKVFRIKNVGLKITGEINNIFNQAYEVIHNYPMPGRNFRVTLKVNI